MKICECVVAVEGAQGAKCGLPSMEGKKRGNEVRQKRGRKNEIELESREWKAEKCERERKAFLKVEVPDTPLGPHGSNHCSCWILLDHHHKKVAVKTV